MTGAEGKQAQGTFAKSLVQLSKDSKGVLFCVMNIKQVKIGDIIPYQKNAKKHDTKQIQKVADSIKRFGWAQPLVIDKNNELIIGHARLLAAKELGLQEVPTVTMENLNEEEVKALRLADNKLNESDWDLGLAIDELKGLSPEMFELTGFDSDLLIEPDDKDDLIPDKAPVIAKLAIYGHWGTIGLCAAIARKRRMWSGLWTGRRRIWCSLIRRMG